MRKAIFAAWAAVTILCLETPAYRANAMPMAAPSAIGLAASQSDTLTQIHDRRWRHHSGVWYRHPAWGPYALPHPYACCGFPDGYGYPPGPFWGLGGYLNSWYM